MNNFKSDFPLLANHPQLHYLDSAATSQKPQAVIDAVTEFYQTSNANIHRGLYDLSQSATAKFEASRQNVADFIHAPHSSEVVFTSGTTESINLVANGWARQYLNNGDIIVVSAMEHHANVVPWLQLKKDLGVELFVLPLDNNFRIDLSAPELAQLDISKVKLLALTHASNVLGTVNPVASIIEYFECRGAKTRVLVDAAQTLPHMPVNVQALRADFVAFSSHKMYGPSGVGVLWAHSQLLENMEPLRLGGNMIRDVNFEAASWAAAPAKFEGGTPNIEGVIGLEAAVDYLRRRGWSDAQKQEADLCSYALEQLQRIPQLTLFGPSDLQDRLGIFSFAIKGVHPHDVAEILNRHQVAVRAGHHCAQPLLKTLGASALTRASLGPYNSRQDIDALVAGVQDVIKTFKVGH